MKTTKKSKSIKKSTFLLSLIAVILITKHIVEWKHLVEQAKSADCLSKQLKYYKEAENIDEYYSRNATPSKFLTIKETIQAIDMYLPKYFPSGPYTRKDIIAMAMIESEFDQYLIGARKEFGIFQIMPESFKDLGINKNQFDIKINTEAALIILSNKYKEHNDYKRGLIGYNGFVVRKGKLSETYWKRFVKARKTIDELFAVTDYNQGV